MRITQEFVSIPNFGFEAPNHERAFVMPVLMSCSYGGFTWMIDSNGIVWISGIGDELLQSPCLSYCLNQIRAYHPFIDIGKVIEVVGSF